MALESEPSSDAQLIEQQQQLRRKPLEISTESEDINITFDQNLAKEQVLAYPDDPEAHFVLAVALTRTSQVEQAWVEVNKSRRLAEKQGGPAYFDKMIKQYEKLLEHTAEDNKVRYHLAWAYYMKAYLLTQYSKRVYDQQRALAALAARNNQGESPVSKDWPTNWVSQTISGEDQPNPDLSDKNSASSANKDEKQGTGGLNQLGRLKSMEQVLRKAEPSVIPSIKHYYRAALAKLDEILQSQPDDLWSKLYRAHLNAEYTGDLDSAMVIWKRCKENSPDNPAPYFFLGEGYLKQGNLKKSLKNVSRAIALRALGN